MYRILLQNIETWGEAASRKPLVLRGARQVGKSYLIEEFGKTFKNFIVLNLEETAEFRKLFENVTDVHELIQILEINLSQSILDGKTLLFIDEIQAAPEAISKLRYFYEKRPKLHVVAAGSLLEFALSERSLSVPVGRIEYKYLHPMSFEEFLLALGQESLAKFLNQYSLNDKIAEMTHNSLLRFMRLYFFVGGMPEAVKTYCESKNFLDVTKAQSSILQTYFDDFHKYKKNVKVDVLQHVFTYFSKSVGRKVKYVNISPDHRSSEIKLAIDLLEKARVMHRVHHSSGNGFPLEAEIKSSSFKTIFLDIGLVNRACGLKLDPSQDLLDLHEGMLAEQFVGQELVRGEHDFEQTRLHYWLREEKNSNAELDYLIEGRAHPVPIEIKAGVEGTLKSLHLFMALKNLPVAVRLFTNTPCHQRVRQNVLAEKKHFEANYELWNLPLYLAGQLRRLFG